VPILSVFVLTGNNVQLQGDTGRRVIPIDIDPKCEHPQDRAGPAPGKGWRYPDLWAGGADPYAGVMRIRREGGDYDHERLSALVAAWFAAFGERPATMSELLARASTDEMLQVAIDAYGSRNEKMTPGLLGKRLAALQGRPVADGRIMQTGIGHGGAKRWQISRDTVGR
jgi:hypothetical protein